MKNNNTNRMVRPCGFIGFRDVRSFFYAQSLEDLFENDFKASFKKIWFQRP